VESILKMKYPALIYHYAGPETGFAAGNNIGLRFGLTHAYSYSLLLNNDIIAERDLLEPLLNIMDSYPVVAMAGPAIYCYDNKKQLWSCGGRIYRWSGRIGGITTLEGLSSGLQDVDYLPGACMLIRNDALKKTGLMSEDYFLGVEEADWAIRARRSGFRVVACSKSVVFHKVGISSRFTPELIYNGLRNRFLFFRRQFAAPLSYLLPCCVLLNSLLEHWEDRRISWRAFMDHWRYRTISRYHIESVRKEITGPVDRELSAW
jgi:GT2 family glycosyltransferase